MKKPRERAIERGRVTEGDREIMTYEGARGIKSEGYREMEIYRRRDTHRETQGKYRGRERAGLSVKG